MNKRRTLVKVSVGIAAFNEANNIAGVLNDILAQKQEGWKLKEVVVYNDGSSDKTVEKARSVKNRFVKVVTDGRRKGKTHRLSQMFKDFTGDILIMFDGDIKFAGDDVITKMVESFSDKKVMLVGGNSTPFHPKTFFQKSVFSTFTVFYRSRKFIKGGNNIFGCTGSILGIRKELAKKIELPKIINEDAFIYLYCISNKYKFAYQDKAVVFYKLPTTLQDYLRQAFRSHPEAVIVELKKYFGGLVDKEFNRPYKFYFASVFMTFMENPIEVLYISAINILCKPFYKTLSGRYKLSWFTASSTH